MFPQFSPSVTALHRSCGQLSQWLHCVYWASADISAVSPSQGALNIFKVCKDPADIMPRLVYNIFVPETSSLEDLFLSVV